MLQHFVDICFRVVALVIVIVWTFILNYFYLIFDPKLILKIKVELYLLTISGNLTGRNKSLSGNDEVTEFGMNKELIPVEFCIGTGVSYIL